MAEALLGFVLQNLGSFVQYQLTTCWGVDQQTHKLSSNLTAIRAVLRDAERKQMTNHAVKDWLQKLTDAAYVLDDILDECSIHFTKMHSDEGHTSCLSRLHPNDILFRFNIAKRMTDITQRFHDIHEEKSRFNLEHGVTEVQTVEDDWRQTSSDITEPVVYGRDYDREQIVKFLLEDASNSEELSIYPIVGMGGLGKTTLAKQVFNDHRVCKHFDLTIWVCVSDDFNTMTILQSILECIIGQNPNLNSLEAMRKKVEEVLHGMRYLLVLDDVWNEDQEKWEQLKGKLQCARAAKGSTILVTTRLEEVASLMQTHPAYHLKELPGDESWSLFKYHAFGPNREETEVLVEIGKEIVRNCIGLPLAIKTMGSLLRDQSEVRQWINVKESSSMTDEDNSIMRALKLSYSNLELSLRRCFSFCAIFPKDFEIDKEDLIHLWMANGFIGSERNIEVEEVGNKVWNKLYRRSFFQEAKCDKFGMVKSFKMHDLFHDLAQSIMGEECATSLEGRLTPLSSRVHYLSSNVSYRGFMHVFKKVESLRTFLDLRTSIYNFCPVPSNHSLRALCTNSSSLSPLKDLTHLRYLSLYCDYRANLNNNLICQMRKLQILKLQGYLRGLPKILTQLQDLRHIVMDDCESVVETLPKISKLRHLRTLSIFVVGSKPGCGLAELHSLNLGGRLRIRGLENVPNEWDAKEANLIGKKELNILHLSWDGNANPKGSNVSVERVLEVLEPPSTLKGFEINGYEGRQLSSWMRNSAVLRDLVDVTLFNCENCEELPPLGKLPHLKRINVRGMKNVKWIDGETYDGVEEKAFPSLEELSVYNLPKLERLLRDEGVEMLPRLSKLTIESCSTLPDGLQRVPSLRDLHIEECTCTSLPDWLGDITSLEVLRIWSCEELRSLPSSIQRLTNLSYLFIQGCSHLKKRCNRETGEDWQYINHIPRLELLFTRKQRFCGF